jgi:hypothetical protein
LPNSSSTAFETTFTNPLSITAKYLKSSGTPFFLRIGSITGKLDWLFYAKIV